MTDLPYGDLVSWGGGSDEPVKDFFNGIHSILDLAAPWLPSYPTKGKIKA